MPDYNFLNLSSAEFEEISRDILQKHLNIYFESFTNGRDLGIDFRHSTNKNENIIVQCKRYSTFESLFKALVKEKEKVEKLNPSRYILTTSVGLTPSQKQKILDLIEPYIKNSEDIYSKDDMNNLLGLYPDIEKQYFKLWLSSINILERILNSKIYNQTNFEEEKIKDTVQLYVENDSYYDAIKVLKNKKYVIISGIPGIGKTTLARILVYHFLANGFEEFIFLSDSIDEGYSIYKENTKQIFLFDDFLGRNFLDKNLSNNEEQKIIRFIENVNKSENKILILTTREYVLAQAKLKYDIFNNPSLEFAKCVIDLSQYTKLVRAKILYNHLFFANINENYINRILKNKAYLKIINHKNYNPRIIETFTQYDIWSNIPLSDFTSKIIEFLDYPESIWKHVYENQISSLSQCILANLMSAGTPILIEDLQKLIQNFAKNYSSKYNITYSSLDFKKSLRELENTFIISKKDSVNNIAIEYQNPSVQDFLVNYLKEHSDFVNDIISSAIYFNQLFQIFAFYEIKNSKGDVLNKNKIFLDEAQKSLIVNKLQSDFDYLNSSTLTLYNSYSIYSSRWVKKYFSDYSKLKAINSSVYIDDLTDLRKFILKRFQEIIIPSDLENDDFSNYLDLFEDYQNELIYDTKEVLSVFFSKINFLEELNDFERFEYLCNKDYEEFTQNDIFYENIEHIMSQESSNADDSNLGDVLYDIKKFGEKFDVDYYDLQIDIENRIKKYEAENEGNDDDYKWNRESSENPHIGNDDDLTIDNMFDSLFH
ncbi:MULTISPECIES: nSTAND3 domain-containing NTPase [Chryseobacterium]|uniref:nSTAND3 domain-containing NTPase n=1 Tax=Chryseobacterium sp. R2A-55 TaxID=2744445 RepID=UPI001F45B37E|nr:restriction endonuclease [Chryseobacterium sp. R2A-55]